MNGNYRHTQRAPLCLLVYGTAIIFLVLGWVLCNEPVIQWVFPPVALLMLVLAGSVHHLTVEDEGDQLSISFGPIPLFRRSVKYENIVSVEIGRTTILDGWGHPHEPAGRLGLEHLGSEQRGAATPQG